MAKRVEDGGKTEWAKHLRPYLKRAVAKRTRRAGKRQAAARE